VLDRSAEKSRGGTGRIVEGVGLATTGGREAGSEWGDMGVAVKEGG